jgi:hypothetical protein
MHSMHNDDENETDDGIETTLLLRSPGQNNGVMIDDGASLVSIEEYMTSFDGQAARKSIQFMSQGIRELKEEISYFGHKCGTTKESSSSSDDEDEDLLQQEMPKEEIDKRRDVWKRRQQQQQLSNNNNNLVANEETPLLV